MNYFKRLYDKFIHSPRRRLFMRYIRKIILPGFDGIPLYDVMKFFMTGLIKGSVTTRASAISFNFFMALFPAIIVLFTLIPYVPIAGFQESLLELLQSLIPQQIFETVEDTLLDIVNRPRGGLLSIGFFLTLYFATNGVSSLIEAFNQTFYTIETRSFLRTQLISVALVFMLAFLLIFTIALITIGPALINWLDATGFLRGRYTYEMIVGVKWLITVLMFLIMYSSLYYFAPARKQGFRFISAGSTLSTILTIVTSIGFNYYVNNFSQYNTLYGSIGTLLIFLLFIYFNSIILLLGFELNASIMQVKRGRKASLNPPSRESGVLKP